MNNLSYVFDRVLKRNDVNKKQGNVNIYKSNTICTLEIKTFSFLQEWPWMFVSNKFWTKNGKWNVIKMIYVSIRGTKSITYDTINNIYL